ncbi:GntR family transcriptional regulator [Trichococcus sp. K1Tr]|uniref:GntR family transcriptional regulator n=1 Tax=Trichococcus sp. K1Tr TaxID=3020847 RepID=UPI00232A801A|nr:GntR family transcriptional regulator [Trichococcus sp. K1Tr]MDB6353413.1 GntR family transcriptional regulator [Trichococcus sp. K1Tr]
MESLERTQTKDYIADILRTEIFKRNIKDGEKLKQSEVAAAMGVSRMPVREALQMLEMEGVLERLENRHMKVNGISFESAKAQFRMIKALEKEICLILSEKQADTQPFRKIADAYKEKMVAKDSEGCRKLELNFHQLLSEATGIPTIKRAHEQLLSGFFTFVIGNYDFDFEENYQHIEKISQQLAENDLSKLMDGFEDYFQYYVEILKKKLEGMNNEHP